MNIGGIAGTLPAAVARNLGLKQAVICASAGVAVPSVPRTAALSTSWLIGTAFVSNAISSVWAVSFVPIVASLTTKRNRATAYSFWPGWGIGLGIVIGAVTVR